MIECTSCEYEIAIEGKAFCENCKCKVCSETVWEDHTYVLINKNNVEACTECYNKQLKECRAVDCSVQSPQGDGDFCEDCQEREDLCSSDDCGEMVDGGGMCGECYIGQCDGMAAAHEDAHGDYGYMDNY